MRTKHGGYRHKRPNPYLEHPYRVQQDTPVVMPNYPIWPYIVLGAIAAVFGAIAVMCVAVIVQELI